MTCQSTKHCPECDVTITCESSGKAEDPKQDIDKGIYYVWGPCCEGMPLCPNCGYVFLPWKLKEFADSLANAMKSFWPSQKELGEIFETVPLEEPTDAFPLDFFGEENNK